MAKQYTVGQILLKHHIPQEFHPLIHDKVMDKKAISNLFDEIAKKAPEKYTRVAEDLARLGFEVATRQGTSITLKDLVSPVDTKKVYDELEEFKKKVDLSKDPQNIKDQRVFDKYTSLMSQVEKDIMAEGLKQNRSLAKIILAGSRGNPQQYRNTITTQGIVVDGQGKARMDMPIKSSFSEGLSLPEYLMVSFGVRSGETLKKISVADGGFAAKQFSRALGTIQVVEHDCGTENGVPYSVDDKESVGAFLAVPVGGYNRNNEITLSMLGELKDKGVRKVIARSPITCQSGRKHHFGALCQMCVGKREKGLPAIDSYVGILAGTAIAEPLTNMAMKARHCIFSEQLVQYPNPENNKKIKDVKVGDAIVGADKNANTFPTKVLAVIDQGEQDVYRYTFRYGLTRQTFTIDATEDHVVLATTYNAHSPNNNKPREFKLGHKHRCFDLVLPAGYTDKNLEREPFAFLIGLLIGDGSYTTNKTGIQYYNFDETSIPHIQNKLAPINLKLHQSPTRHQQYKVTTKNLAKLPKRKVNKNGRFVSSTYYNPIRVKLEELGMFGKKAHEKTIPDAAYGWDNESIAELMSGLFFTDGSVNLDHDRSKNANAFRSYSYSCSSKKLVEQIKYLLESRFGIYTSAITTKRAVGKPYKFGNREGVGNHDQYTIRIRRPESVLLFEKYVKLFGEKGKRLEDSTASIYKQQYPYYTCRRIKTEYLGKKHCYDLTVDCPDNLFVLANGAIVHNSGGAATSLGGVQGFKLISQIANIPESFVGKAPLASEDGIVRKIEPSTAGGSFIHINDKEYYVSPHHEIKVKQGDTVEQGQALSTGLIDPSEAVRYRGIGDGRRNYMDSLKKAFSDSKLYINRRNLELVAKAAIDHVKITNNEGLSHYLPDQIVSYSALEKEYEPRVDAKEIRTDLAYGKYLEKPVLHYTIGTRVSSPMIRELHDHKIEHILVHEHPPGFEPTMVRLLDVPAHVPDFMHVLNSTNLSARFINMVNKGSKSDLAGPSPVAGLAYGEGFGERSGKDVK